MSDATTEYAYLRKAPIPRGSSPATGTRTNRGTQTISSAINPFD